MCRKPSVTRIRVPPPARYGRAAPRWTGMLPGVPVPRHGGQQNCGIAEPDEREQQERLCSRALRDPRSRTVRSPIAGVVIMWPWLGIEYLNEAGVRK